MRIKPVNQTRREFFLVRISCGVQSFFCFVFPGTRAEHEPEKIPYLELFTQ